MHSTIDPIPSLPKASSPAALIPICNRQDFGRFYDHYAPLIYGHLLRLTADASLAASILTEVFRTLWVERTTFNEHQARSIKQHPVSWLLGIAHRNGRLTQALVANKHGVDVQLKSGKSESDFSTADWFPNESAHC